MLIKNFVPHNLNISVCFVIHSLMMAVDSHTSVAGFMAPTNKVV
jgi:hypothetical protein